MFCFGFEGNPKIQNVHITSRHNIYWKSTKIPSIKTIWLINHVFCHLIRPMYSYAVHETNNNLNFYHSNTHTHTNLRVPIYMFKIEWYFHNSHHIEFDFFFHYFWFTKYVSSQFGNMKSWKSQTYGFSLCAFAIAFSPAVFPRYRRWFFFHLFESSSNGLVLCSEQKSNVHFAWVWISLLVRAAFKADVLCIYVFVSNRIEVNK